MSGKPLRVLVVEDSATQRAMIMAALATDPEIEVAGWAANGAEAVARTALLKPDVITMDLRMPVMDGLEATRKIMQQTPTPIVMVTSQLPRHDRELAVQALEAGVLTIMPKPEQVSPGHPNEQSVRDLVQAVKTMARVKTIRRWAPERLAHKPPPVVPAAPTAGVPAATPARPRIVAIGASTGGPQAIQTVLTALPASFPLPVLVVQHIAAGFESGLVDWLRPQCALPLELAAAGNRLDHPAILIAPAGSHLVARAGAVELSLDPPVGAHRPSATALFQSIAREYGPAAVGVLLTGMGDDGAAGLRDMKRRGATTIAQDEASSVVWGMPAAAIAMGVVDRVLAPDQIGPALVALAAGVARG